ncbi:type I-E CRISPR-associated protein Cse2/CasB [Streptomyces niveus]
MPTAAEQRAYYDDFVAYVNDLCTQPGVRSRLSTGRGRPVEQCAALDRFLTPRTAGRAGRRAYYTTATLIALAGPQAHTPGVRPAPGQPGPGRITEADIPVLPQAVPLLPVPAAGHNTPCPAEAQDTTTWYRRPNLGATFAAAVQRAHHHEQRTDDTLHVLTRLGDDHLHRRLPAHINRLLSDGLTPDWAVLLHDLIQRTYHRESVGLRWRDAFYLALTDQNH